MMNVSHTHKTKILEGPMALGRSCINAASLTLDGQPLPAWLTLDALHGTVQRIVPTAEDRTLYAFAYEHFRAAAVAVQADKTQVAADGVDTLTLTVTCEDTTEATVPVAIYSGDTLLGAVDVTMTDGSGQHQMTIEVAGTYHFEVSQAALDATWNLPKFAVEQAAIVEAVNA